MAIQDQVFSIITKILHVISLRNVVIWSLAALVSLVGFTIFENRAVILEALMGDDARISLATIKVSDTSKLHANQFVTASDLIVGVMVLNADIRNNRRIPVYWYFDDGQIQTQVTRLIEDRIGGIPLFTADEKNNETIVGVINGEFACGTFAETGSGSIFPGFENRFPFVCRSSLPPYYGQFSGYIIFALGRAPTAEEAVELKSQALTLSTEIYFRDVLQQNRKLSN